MKYERNSGWKDSAHDRMDTFIYCLNEFFVNTENDNHLILEVSSNLNKPFLTKYLRESFNDVYDYCQKVNFIFDK